MTYARATFSDDLDTLPRMPDWVTSSHAKMSVTRDMSGLCTR